MYSNTNIKKIKNNYIAPSSVPHNGIGTVVRTPCYKILMVILVLFFIADSCLNWRISSWLAINREQVVGAGEFYRVLGYAFCHMGIWHLVSNLLFLFYVGMKTEEYYGHAKFICIFLVTSIIGGLCSLAFTDITSIGASGGIFGCMGAIIAALPAVANQDMKEYINVKKTMRILIILNVINAIFAIGIDNWAHIGGFVGGFLLGKALDVYLEVDNGVKRKKYTILTCLFVGVVGFILFTCPKDWHYNGILTIFEAFQNSIKELLTEYTAKM